MVRNQNWKIIFSILGFVLVLIYWLDGYIKNTEEILYQRLESHVISDMSDIASNIDGVLKESIQGRGELSLFEYFKTNKVIHSNFERELGLLINSKLKYLYVIYKDEKQRFRFLADGSKEDKGRLNQKLDVKSSEYTEIYKTRKEKAITQKSLENLSITFLYPIMHNKNVEAILVFDFSTAFEYELRKVIEPLKTMFTLIYVMIGVFLFVTLVQTFLYYKARKRSFIDSLTSCFNRQYLRYFLDTNDISEYRIMMIDFDFFKKVNDNYGHQIGDKVLVFGTNLIKSTLVEEDRCFRYGGEEFLVLVHEKNDISRVAENIKKTIEYAHFIEDNININITVSIGINPVPTHARNTSQAISIADSMLYQAKTQGRNRIETYKNGMELNIEEKYSTSYNIHNVVEALENDRVVCCFHKIIDKDKKVYKYEALVRYIDSSGNLVYPNHFLPDITHTKVYTDVTKRVIDICLNTMLDKKVSMSLNLNVNDLLNKVLVDYLIEGVKTLEKAKYTLTVEILENEEIKSINELSVVIDRLHRYGIKVAIDDFGSGFANFNYLVELNVDYIKIDGYLVQSSMESEKSKNIVKSIIDLAHTMGIKTIVEFVSTKEIYEMMLSLETDYLQGFYISKPDPKI